MMRRWDNITSRNTIHNKNHTPTPKYKKIRQFLVLTGYYRNHINHYVDIINTLIKLLKKNKSYLWTELHKRAFLELHCLQTPLVLISLDPSKPYFLLTDASNHY